MTLHEQLEAGDLSGLRQSAAAGADLDASFPDSDECFLSIAASKGDLILVELLLELGADPNNPNTVTPPLSQAAATGSLDVVMALVKAGAEVDVRNEDGSTPLMEAAWCGHLEIVHVLLAHGANPKRKDRRGNSALFSAADANNIEVCKLLTPLSTPKEREKARIRLRIHAQGGVDAGTSNGWVTLKEFNLILHTFRSLSAPKPCELKHDLAYGASALMAVGNAAVLLLNLVKPEEVVIVCDDHAPLVASKHQVLFVTCPKQAGVTWSRDVDASFPQSLGNGNTDTFVKVKSNLHPRPCLSWAEQPQSGALP